MSYQETTNILNIGIFLFLLQKLDIGTFMLETC